MGRVLGLSFFFHDSAASLVEDGEIVAAALEERFCRRKHTNEFPKHAIEYCLEAANLRSVNELDAIVFYEKPVLKMQRAVETLVSVWPRGLATFSQQLPSYLASKLNVHRTIERSLPGYRGPILFSEHHLSHAASAYYCSPYDEAAILTIDGVGEWETTTIGHAEGRKICLMRAIHFPHSIGLLYSALTSYLGFRVNDGEWKVMGLAPYGEPKYIDSFHQLVRTNADGSFRLNMEFFVHHYSNQWTAHNRRWQNLFGFPRRDPDEPIEQCHEDLAMSGQAVAEELILNLAHQARRCSGSRNLVLAGGVALNSVANWKIEQAGIFDNVWIQPAAGDDGAALGAALLVSQELMNDPPCPEMTDVYLGPETPQKEIDFFLKSKDIAHQQCDEEELLTRVADFLIAGKVVGWFQGRMEFGPRALGSRSVLADPTNPDMKALINTKIKYREYFRPFAPVVTKEKVHEYFEVEPGTDMPFMLKVPQVRSNKRSVIPAVTHKDGSGRVQTVTKESNPRLYGLVKAFERCTGVPVLLNTSFNVRGEPIVCSIQDAYHCFVNTGIDVLVLGRSIITQKPNSDLDHAAGYLRSDKLEASIGSEPLNANMRKGAIVWSTTSKKPGDTTDKVLSFYRELPFNYFSNAIDTANQLLRSNRLKAYSPLYDYLSRSHSPRVIDVGCGVGWFINSACHYHGAKGVGVDLNPNVLKQARSVARLMDVGDVVEFSEANLFDYKPEIQFDVVNSLGVLHHTPDCHAAVRKILGWVADGGYVHLGLYHEYGRRPFLEHFRRLRREGASEAEMIEVFAKLNPEITDETHMLSWFRDQVLHPHETQHSFDEIHTLLLEEDFVIQRTSINNFKPISSHEEIVKREQKLEVTSRRTLYKKRQYFPGFFVVWAKRR